MMRDEPWLLRLDEKVRRDREREGFNKEFAKLVMVVDVQLAREEVFLPPAVIEAVLRVAVRVQAEIAAGDLMGSPVDDLVERMIRNYPSLFANRTQALRHLLCVAGNGYRWVNGALVCTVEERERTDEEVQVTPPDWVSEEWAGDVGEQIAEDNLRYLDIRRRAAELARTPGPLEWATVYAGHYLLPEQLPDDARPEWRAAAAEYEDTVRRLHGL